MNISVLTRLRKNLTSRRMFDTLLVGDISRESRLHLTITNNTLQFVERRTYAGFEGSDLDCS